MNFNNTYAAITAAWLTIGAGTLAYVNFGSPMDKIRLYSKKINATTELVSTSLPLARQSLEFMQYLNDRLQPNFQGQEARVDKTAEEAKENTSATFGSWAEKLKRTELGSKLDPRKIDAARQTAEKAAERTIDTTAKVTKDNMNKVHYNEIDTQLTQIDANLTTFESNFEEVRSFVQEKPLEKRVQDTANSSIMGGILIGQILITLGYAAGRRRE